MSRCRNTFSILRGNDMAVFPMKKQKQKQKQKKKSEFEVYEGIPKMQQKY